MSKEPTPPGGTRPARAPRQNWTLDAGQAQTVLAGARRALFVMVGVLVVIWVIQIGNWADGYNLSQAYGIRPRDVASLPYILTAPFLHFSWTHIEGNSGPLFIFGFLAAYRGIGRFAGVTAVVVLTSGLAAWFFSAPRSVDAGASGVIFGYFGYIIVRGIFDRHGLDILVGAVMALCFAYQFAVLLPHRGIGWQAHVGGLVGGVASGWLLRERRASKPASAAVQTALPPAGAIAGPVTAPKSLRKADKKAAGKPGGKAAGASPAIDPANPRAELYKQLDDMGL